MDPRKIGTNCGPMVLSLTLFQENYVSWLIVNHGECWCWTDKSIKWEAFKILWDWKDFASYLEAHSEHSTTPKMEFFTRIVDSWKLFAIFTNCFILNVRLGYEYPTVTHPPVHYQTFINYFCCKKNWVNVFLVILHYFNKCFEAPYDRDSCKTLPFLQKFSIIEFLL